MAGGGNAIRGSRVGAGPMGEAERGEAAPRQNITYFCSHEHRTLIAFAVEATVPGHLGLPALRPPREHGLGQPTPGSQDRALQDPPRLREGAPLRRRGQGHPQRGHRHPPRPSQVRRRHLLIPPTGGFWLALARRPGDFGCALSRRPGVLVDAARCLWIVRASDWTIGSIMPRWTRPGSTIEHLFLTARCPLPLDAAVHDRAGVGLGCLAPDTADTAAQGLVRRMLQGVYVAAQAVDTMDCAPRALALVVPEAAVVTDRTAAWLHGVDILPRSSGTHSAADQRLPHHRHPDGPPGVASAVARLLRTDVTVVQGVRVTTALRTALDLGRLLWRYDALAAIDGFLRIGVPHEILIAEIGRFRGYRGVRQLRALAPLGDGRAESPGESALRLHWYDAGLPRPELQIWVYDDDGVAIYRLDIALPEIRYARRVRRRGVPHQRRGPGARRGSTSVVRGATGTGSSRCSPRTDVYEPRPDPMPTARGRVTRRAPTVWTPSDAATVEPSTLHQKSPLGGLASTRIARSAHVRA